MDLSTLTIKKAAELLSKKEISSVDLTREYLKNIEAKNKNLNSILEGIPDAEKWAKASDDARLKGESGVLLGIPLAIKDNILIKGKRASASSKILENYTASYDATAISRLKD